MDWPASLPCDLQERRSSEMLTGPVRDIPLNTDLTLLHLVEDVVEESPIEITISAAELLLGPSEDNSPPTPEIHQPPRTKMLMLLFGPTFLPAPKPSCWRGYSSKEDALSWRSPVKFLPPERPATADLVGWFCCFTSQVNSYGHCGTVSSPNHTFSWAGLNKRITSNSCTYFRL